MLAFHGEPTLKTAVMHRLREHRRLDTIVQGTYFDKGRGCHLGCITHINDNTHEAAERLFGIERRVGYWLEAVFEGLPQESCAAWVIESTEAIPVGADLSKCHHHLAAWLLGESKLLTITDINRDAIEQVHRLHLAAANGEPLSDEQWSAARSAAESAAARSAAESAAARSAARSAWSAARSAWSAARSARSAAWSAAAAESAAVWSAAQSAAWSARSARSARSAWKDIAAKSVEIFRAAPVIGGQPEIASCVRSELCARQLWCPDGDLVVA